MCLIKNNKRKQKNLIEKFLDKLNMYAAAAAHLLMAAWMITIYGYSA